MSKRFFKIIAVCMAVIMASVYLPLSENDGLFSIQAQAATYKGSLGSNVKWSYDTSKKQLTVEGSGSMSDNSGTPKDFTSYRAAIVTSIYKHATKIVIKDGVTSIGNNTFRSFQKVTSVTLPSSIKKIGQSAFEGCSALTSITLNNGLETIGAYAFKNTKFASVSLPSSLTSIGDYAFAGISGLKFKCDYGTYANNYCKSNSVSYSLKSNVLVCEPKLDMNTKQVTLTLKYVYNPAKVNAANLTLTYNEGVTPVSTATIENESQNASKVVVFNKTGKISVAVMASEYVEYSSSASECSLEMATIKFNINENADNAEFNFSADVLLVDGKRVTQNPASSIISLHNYTESVSKKATCVSKGEKTLTCTICGKTSTGEIPVDKNNHSGKTEVKNVKASTCKEKGYSGDTVCADCGVIISTGTELPLSEHSYKTSVVEPDCVNGGYTLHTCTVCNHSYKDNETSAGSHKYDKTVVEPDCTKAGYTIYTCSVCGASYRGDNVSSLGHDYNENGECVRCGEVLVTAPIFNNSESFVVDTDGKTVISKLNNIKVEQFIEMINGTGWTVTDSQGNPIDTTKKVATSYILKHSSGVTYVIIVLGDVNSDGSVTASDARMTLRAAAKIDVLDEIKKKAADSNSDGKIIASDARILLRVAAKLQQF